MKRSNFRMRVRRSEGVVILVMALLLSLLVVLVLGEPAQATAGGKRGGRRSALPAAATPGSRQTPAALATAPAAPATAPAHTAGKSQPTTLEAITIQGEIDVPQVLFITGRPRPLYDDGSYRLFRPTPQRLLEEVTLPSELFLELSPAPRAGGKEVVR